MAFQVQKIGDVTAVDVEGQLIVGNRQELKQRVLEELEGGSGNQATLAGSTMRCCGKQHEEPSQPFTAALRVVTQKLVEGLKLWVIWVPLWQHRQHRLLDVAAPLMERRAWGHRKSTSVTIQMARLKSSR
jgi:hypothetical protein